MKAHSLLFFALLMPDYSLFATDELFSQNENHSIVDQIKDQDVYASQAKQIDQMAQQINTLGQKNSQIIQQTTMNQNSTHDPQSSANLPIQNSLSSSQAVNSMIVNNQQLISELAKQHQELETLKAEEQQRVNIQAQVIIMQQQTIEQLKHFSSLLTENKKEIKPSIIPITVSYFDKYKKLRGVKLTSSGYAFRIVHQGKGGAINNNDLFTINMTEFNQHFAVVSQAKEVRLQYQSSLPALIYQTIRYLHAGGRVKVVVPENKIYSESNRPNKVKKGSSLIYLIDLLNVG